MVTPPNDAAGDVTADEAAPEAGSGWTPAALGGALSLWLEADTGLLNQQTWKDQSGNGNDATALNQQSSWMFQVYSGEVNGHAAIHCPGNGTFFQIADSQSLHWGNADWTLVFVTRITSGTSTLWAQDNQQGHPLNVTTGAFDFQLQVGTTLLLLAVQDITKYHAVIMRGQQLQMMTDGYTASGPLAAIDLSNIGSGVAMCMTNQNTGPVGLAEVVGIQGTLSSQDFSSLQGYLHDKYAL